MKKLIEDLHFANNEEFKKKKQLYLEEIFNMYNQTQSELQKTHTFKEIIDYTNKLNKIELLGERNNILNGNKSKTIKELSEYSSEEFSGKRMNCSIGNINDDDINEDESENFSFKPTVGSTNV
tara:strand:- start:732 stop:1100 length:369 start_codon:yes stop_codon:yes gene_type:complete